MIRCLMEVMKGLAGQVGFEQDSEKEVFFHGFTFGMGLFQ